MNAVYNSRGSVVGVFELDGDDLWLVKRKLEPTVHQLRMPPAWATDAEHLRILRERGGVGVRIHDTRGAIWEASLAKFTLHGFEGHRLHGTQGGLALGHWKHYIGKQLEMEMM